MYQFTENLSNLGVSFRNRNYRWRGLGIGLVLGWLPAWGLTYATGCGGWGFGLFWFLFLPLSFMIGKLIKK